MTEGRVRIHGIEVWYRVAGSGPGVLLLHAGGADADMWDGQFDRLAQTYRVIAFDYPGAGRSPWPARSWIAIDVIRGVLDKLGEARVAVVGLSLGGTLAIDWAIDRPDRTWALAAAGCGARGNPNSRYDDDDRRLFAAIDAGDLEEAAALLTRMASTVPSTPEVDDRIMQSIRKNVRVIDQLSRKTRVDAPGYRPHREIWEWPKWSAYDRLEEVRVPTLLMYGGEEHLFTREEMDLMWTRIPGSELVVFDGLDHFFPIKAPDRFLGVLYDFLGRARSQESPAGQS
jgi:3-oxoadipate enol-lactonase